MPRALTLLIAAVAIDLAILALFRRLRGRRAGTRKHFIVTHAGSELRPTGQQVSDAVVSVLMGGIVLDLRKTQLTERPAKIEVFAIMGGAMILVPEDWRVDSNVDAIMGGVQDMRKGEIEADRPTDLMLTGRLIMGGLGVGTEMPQKTGAAAGESKPRSESISESPAS